MFDRDDYVSRFWEALENVSTGLLSVSGGEDDHALPMTAHFDDRETLYFFAPASGRLTEGGSGRSTFYYTGPQHDLFATIHGSLSLSQDSEARRRHWTDEVERWFPGQRDSDSVQLLAFRPEKGEIWIPSSAAASARFETSSGPIDKHAEVIL